MVPDVENAGSILPSPASVFSVRAERIDALEVTFQIFVEPAAVPLNDPDVSIKLWNRIVPGLTTAIEIFAAVPFPPELVGVIA
jgi:hypothetical protein